MCVGNVSVYVNDSVFIYVVSLGANACVGVSLSMLASVIASENEPV